MRDAEPFVVHAPANQQTTVSDGDVGSPRTIEPQGARTAESYEVTNPSSAPYRAHGKVFFTSDDGYDYVCSGTVVSSPEGNTVVTAGHCAYEPETGSFVHNWMFVPAYRNGNDPYGTWVAGELFTTQAWKTSGDFRYDVAFAALESNSGDSIQDLVGSRGIVFNQDPYQQVDAIGYPAGSPFSGEKMIDCDTQVSYRNGKGAMAPLGIDCDMTGGSSGGGWVIQDQYVNSVVSFGIVGRPDVLYGPYFGTVAEALYEDATGSTPPDPEPTPEPTGEPPPPPDSGTHDMSLSLSLIGHLQATGSLEARDGYLPCAAGATVEIYRLNRYNTGIYVDETTTDADGNYVVSLPNRRGRYLAYAPEGSTSDGDFCTEGVSRLARRRYR
jgi:V8-like Glu-specific endopeptidase